jgi:hypothetical protein
LAIVYLILLGMITERIVFAKVASIASVADVHYVVMEYDASQALLPGRFWVFANLGTEGFRFLSGGDGALEYFAFGELLVKSGEPVRVVLRRIRSAKPERTLGQSMRVVLSKTTRLF